MSLSSFIDDLPIETWAAFVGRIVLRTRRRIARKPFRTGLAAAATLAVVTTGVNALWEQESRHPAPLWGAAADEKPLVATHAPVEDIPREAAAPSSLVGEVQAGLAESGYFSGMIDGILGEDTAEAIRAFEADRGLPVTGEPSVELVVAIGEAETLEAPAEDIIAQEVEVASVEPAVVAAPKPAVVTSVRDIQAALNDAGYGPLDVDGVMGPRTREAMDRFAQANGLSGKGLSPAVLNALSQAAR